MARRGAATSRRPSGIAGGRQRYLFAAEAACMVSAPAGSLTTDHAGSRFLRPLLPHRPGRACSGSPRSLEGDGTRSCPGRRSGQSGKMTLMSIVVKPLGC